MRGRFAMLEVAVLLFSGGGFDVGVVGMRIVVVPFVQYSKGTA
jgi:hypothetical protein